MIVSVSNGIDCVVVSYHTPSDLSDFLRSFVEFRPTIPHTLTIIDVEADEEDVLFAEIALDSFGLSKHVGYMTTHSNFGYSYAVNTGVAFGSHDTIVAFNADICLTPGAVEGCTQLLHSRPDYGVVGPKQLDSGRRITHAGIFGTLENPRHRGFHELDRNKEKYKDIRDDCVSVSGSAYFTKRDVWDELWHCPTYMALHPDVEGAFLPTSHYYEETWYSYHCHAHGYKVVYNGETDIVHKWHTATPVGGIAESRMPESKKMFQIACDSHKIPHD